MRRLACLLIAIAGLAGCGAASAQPKDAARLPALHRFIGDDGLGRGGIRRSDLDALWGAPEVEKPRSASPTSGSRERWLLLEYTSRGLLFTTPAGTYGMADPPIETAYVTEPFDGCTPQGLCIGMPKDAAMPIISAYYKITGDQAVSFGNSGRVTGRSYSARNRGWRQTHSMSFSFDEGRLRSMTLQLEPSPLISGADLRSALGELLGFSLLVLLGLVVDAVKPHVDSMKDSALWEFSRLGLGAGLMLTGVAGAVIGFGALAGGGNGYARMVWLVMGLGASGLVVSALFVFSRSRNAVISKGASAILLLGLIVLLAAKMR